MNKTALRRKERVFSRDIFLFKINFSKLFFVLRTKKDIPDFKLEIGKEEGAGEKEAGACE